MSRTAALNGAAVVLCLALSVLAVGGGGGRAAAPTDRPAAGEAPARIASASTIADRLLLDLCPPRHVIAVTARSATGPDAHRFRGYPTLRALDDLEAIVSLRPDVLLVSDVGDPRRVARVREAGVEVIELGAPTGLASLLEDARRVARLCGVPDEGARYADGLAARMSRVAVDVPAPRRRSGLYLSVYGDRYFGGTVGSSYHDVLQAAGLHDAAAERFRGWPQLAVEQILELDPEVLVTRDGMRSAICAHPTLGALTACRSGQVVEIDGELLDDPGPAMLDAAEAIRDAVYPR